ncbi:MAG: tRNA (adenosine(37)-N6)-threonylcarbamoyltransferase complex ATPase subunit type 1 TsaE [Pseudomonadota bacterium]|nr:tRNA (adenosine(37)-N6)-threonylcarbamoyltransferase complex ATPase subunit type 1 TsaE [Pseudomonadota bacterium]
MSIVRRVDDERGMEALGAALAARLMPAAVIFLHGELGAGKTTLVRGLLRALGYAGAVKSPTYTLVEPYDLDCGRLYHFDLYRMQDPAELEFLGFRDYLENHATCVVEWPERGGAMLPAADIDVFISRVDHARSVQLVANSDGGAALLSGLE